MKRLKVANFVLSIFLTLGLLLILAVGAARAVPLNLTLEDFPEITTSSIIVDYDEKKLRLRARGTPEELNNDGSMKTITDGDYNITATIDVLGNATDGSLTIQGTIAALGYASGTLLTGNLTAFGFPDAGGDPLEFLFDVTGGDAASLFGPVVGIKLSDSGFTGSFVSNFKNTGKGKNTLAPHVATPEPASLLLMVTGLGALFGFGLRKRSISRRSIS